MKKHLLHIALVVTAASLTALDASAQLSPLLTPRLKLKDPGSVNSINIAPPTLAAPYTLTLPPDDGTASQVLTTDGNGVLTWTTQSSGSGTLNTIAKFTSATTIGNSNLDDDGTTIGIGQWGVSQRNVIIGNTATSSSIRLRAGTGGIDIGATDIAAGSTISVGGGGNGYTLNLGSGATLAAITQTINVGTGASTGTKLITIGSDATTSSTTLISGSGGINLNASINQPTNINTGTSTGAVSIGNSLSTTNVVGTTNINTTGNANTTIGSATTTGTTTIATNSSTGRFVVSGLPVLTSGTDDVLIINASNQISRIAQTNLVGSSWQLTGNDYATSSGALGVAPTGTFLGSRSTSTAKDLRLVANGLTRLIIDGTTGLISVGSIDAAGAVTINSAGSGTTSIGTSATAGTVTIGRTSGTITTIGAIGHTGTITSSGLITGTAGVTISGATSVTGAATINTTGNGSTTIGSATTTGTTTIATNGTSGRFVVSGLPTVTTSDDVAVVNASNQVSRMTQASLVSSGMIGARSTLLSAVSSHLITDVNVTTNDIISVTLETTTSTAVIPVFTIVRAAGSFTVHFSAPFTGHVNYTIINK
jgi:hypothetical protein